MSMKLKHFDSVDDVKAYVYQELLDTLKDDLHRMRYDEPAFYSAEDRKDMKNRIKDIEAVRELEGL